MFSVNSKEKSTDKDKVLEDKKTVRKKENTSSKELQSKPDLYPDYEFDTYNVLKEDPFFFS